MSEHDDDEARSPLTRLCVPVSLVVAFAGTATCVAMAYGGCHQTTDPPIDASTSLPNLTDGRTGDGGSDGGLDDGGPRDAAPDTPIV